MPFVKILNLFTIFFSWRNCRYNYGWSSQSAMFCWYAAMLLSYLASQLQNRNYRVAKKCFSTVNIHDLLVRKSTAVCINLKSYRFQTIFYRILVNFFRFPLRLKRCHRVVSCLNLWDMICRWKLKLQISSLRPHPIGWPNMASKVIFYLLLHLWEIWCLRKLNV